MSRSSMLLIAIAVLVPYTLLVVALNGAAEDATNKAAAYVLQSAKDGLPQVPVQVAALKADAAWYRKVVYLLNMSLMFFVLYIGLGPVTSKALDDGIASVSEQLLLAEKRSEVAKNELADAIERMAKIDTEVEALLKREREAAESEAARLRDLGDKESTQIVDNAELSAQREAKDLREAVLAKVAHRAVEKALDGMEGSLDEATRKHLTHVMIEGVSV